MPSSRGSSQPRGWTQVTHIGGRLFTNWATYVIWIMKKTEKVTEETKEIIEENRPELKAPVLSEENPGRSK